jgi:GTP-binding protein
MTESTASSPDPLVIRSLEFLGGLAMTGGWRPAHTLPEIAFVGRSNVGKSSLLNLLVRRKAFARVSNTPGRTQEINFFKVNDALVFVDLPGYGYARVSKDKRHEWQPLIDNYLRSTHQLRGVVVLLDIRREPSNADVAMFDYLSLLEIPVLVAVTKSDKLSKAAGAASLETILGVTGADAEQVVTCSAVTGEGRSDIAEALNLLLAAPAWTPPAGAEATWRAR